MNAAALMSALARPRIVAIALLALANLIVLVAVTWPMLAAASSSGARSRVGQEAHDAIVPALENARRVYTPLLDAEAALAQLRADVTGRAGSVADMVSTLRAALDASGLEVDRINYQTQPREQLGLLQVQVELPVRGQYRQLRRFLSELIGAPLFAVIERVGAATPTRNDASGDLNMSVTLSAFTAMPGQPASPAPDAGGNDAASTPSVRTGDPARVARDLGERLRKLPPPPPAIAGLRLADLQREPEPGGAAQRNLFAFAGAFAPRPPVRESVADSAPSVAPDYTPEPVMPWDLLGITRTLDGPRATLSNGTDVLLAREGEVLPDGLRVVRIDLEFVVIDAGNSRTRLRLGKERE